MNNPTLRRLIQRICVLAVLVAALLFVATPTRVAADDCSTCDTNYNACSSQARSNYDDCINFGGDPILCKLIYSAEWDACWSDYSRCLFNYPGCTITYPNGIGTPVSTCQTRSACDDGCLEEFFGCVANGGTTCAQDRYDCSIGCCP